MKRLVAGIASGFVIGSVAGRLALLLSPFWSAVAAFVLSAAITFWALSSMRELDRRKRIIDEILAELAEVKQSQQRTLAILRPPAPRPKDLGLPLQ